jgi:hypothetical protein
VPPYAGSLIAIMFVVAVSACGGKADALAKATHCLRDRDARVTAEPRPLADLSRQRGWAIRRFLIGDNGLNLLVTRTDAAAREAYRRVAEAHAAIDPTRPAPHRHERIVYWWDAPPTPSDRAILRKCVTD